MMKIRYAVHKTSNDWFPVMFRGDCERTFFDRNTGKDESMVEVMERLAKCDYELRDQPPKREER